MCPQNIKLQAKLPKPHFWKEHFSYARSVSELSLRLGVNIKMPRDILGFSKLSCDRSLEMQGAEGRAVLTLP